MRIEAGEEETKAVSSTVSFVLPLSRMSLGVAFKVLISLPCVTLISVFFSVLPVYKMTISKSRDCPC